MKMVRSKKLKLSNDPHHDWRDPKMPVFAKGKYHPPEAMERSAKLGMAKDNPTYDKDPTYNLRRKK